MAWTLTWYGSDEDLHYLTQTSPDAHTVAISLSLSVVDNVGFNQPRAKLLTAQRGGPLRGKEVPEKVL